MNKLTYLKPDTFMVKVEAQAMLAGSGGIQTDDDKKVSGGIQCYGFADETFIQKTKSSSIWGSAWDTGSDSDYDFSKDF